MWAARMVGSVAGRRRGWFGLVGIDLRSPADIMGGLRRNGTCGRRLIGRAQLGAG